MNTVIEMVHTSLYTCPNCGAWYYPVPESCSRWYGMCPECGITQCECGFEYYDVLEETCPCCGGDDNYIAMRAVGWSEAHYDNESHLLWRTEQLGRGKSRIVKEPPEKRTILRQIWPTA